MEKFEDTLRCRICKQIYTAPTMTSCGHTFCSLCIRRHLDGHPKCPLCLQQTQSSSLRSNHAVSDIIEAWNVFNPEVTAALDSSDAASRQQIPQSRKRTYEVDLVSSPDSPQSSSSFGSLASAPGSIAPSATAFSPLSSDPADGDRSACPICQKMLPIADIQGSHIDNCLRRQARPIAQPPQLKKIPLVNYATVSDTKLRQMLVQLGLSSKGNRQRLQARHREWVHQWNANTEDRRPKTVLTLKKAIHEWDAAQDRTEHSVKDIDIGNWNTRYADEFSELTVQARNSLKRPEPESL